MDMSSQPVVEISPLFCSQRLTLAMMVFLGNCVSYFARVNMSVAILCMVRSDVTVLNGSLSNVTNVASHTVDSCGGPDQALTADLLRDDTGEFSWDKGTQSKLLAMYFYGYIFTQVPGGWLASRFGGRRVWGVCMFVSAVCTLLTPFAVRTHIYIAYGLRFLLGFVSGVNFPCIQAIFGRWVPPLERSIMNAIASSGMLLGNIFTFSISGVLCKHGFDNGWGSIFYLSGVMFLLWVVAWFPVTSDTPAQHKRVSAGERKYIEGSIGRSSVAKVSDVPWVSIIRSGPLWAIIVSHFCGNWLTYTLLTSLPTFMKESLRFDVSQNGALSSAPYLTQLVTSLMSGVAGDKLRQRRVMSTTAVRKTFQLAAFWGSAVCIVLAGQMTCDQRYWAVVLLCLCVGFMGLTISGFTVNHLDLAPAYAGILFGITNTMGTVPGMIAPLVAGAMTPNRSAEEWRSVFYVCGAVAGVGGIIYVILADGELQEWAVPPDVSGNMEMTFPADEKEDDSLMEKSESYIQDGGECDVVIKSGNEK